jgi:methylated-DNA-[protein]-cysteine S-methyltransferase
MNTSYGPDITDLIDALPAVTETELRDLHGRLADSADARQVLDVAYRTLDTPVGTLLLAATVNGLVRVAFETEGHDKVLQSLADRVSPRILNTPKRLDVAAREIDEYFGGARQHFDLPLDFRLTTGFRRQILAHLSDIGYGQTASYGSVAAAAGSPKAVRAVGTACANNPLPVVVPCHRVVRSDGSLGGYLGGLAAKQLLLTMEAA